MNQQMRCGGCERRLHCHFVPQDAVAVGENSSGSSDRALVKLYTVLLMQKDELFSFLFFSTFIDFTSVC